MIFLFLSIIIPIYAHIRLNYPPARFPNLDYLDNIRTNFPCGIPKSAKNKGIRTDLLAGTDLEIFWHLAAAHEGGFRIELLDEEDNITMTFEPENRTDYTDFGDFLTQSKIIKLPTTECLNCGIRISRQAHDVKENYTFWSCADVNIVTNTSTFVYCNGRGTHQQDDTCKCYRLFSGNTCEHTDECFDDTDCGEHGSCVTQSHTSYPRNVCFCKLGYFGAHCSKLNTVIDFTQLNESLYNVMTVGEDNNTILYRVIDETEELEMILQFTTSTWIGVGWRPLNLTPASCPSATLLSLNVPFGMGNSGDPSVLHPMDCMDMVIGSARGSVFRVDDYWSVSRSTPMPDQIVGGRRSLTASGGWEQDGVTTIWFRRKLDTGDPTDHKITQGNMVFIWAYGQDTREGFYEPDLLKYHGKANRGVTTIDFYRKNQSDSDGLRKQPLFIPYAVLDTGYMPSNVQLENGTEINLEVSSDSATVLNVYTIVITVIIVVVVLVVCAICVAGYFIYRKLTHKSNAYVVHDEHLSHDRDPAMYAFHTISDNENNNRKLGAGPVEKESDDHL